MPDLRHYRSFVEIAARGSYTAAASALHITQSALSEQIANLERELGCRLLDRGRHGASLTIAGERILEQVHRLLTMAGDIERSAQRLGQRTPRVIHVGATIGPLLNWMPEVMVALQDKSQGLEVHLRDIPTAEAVLEVGLGHLDVGIVSLPSRSLPQAENLGIERIVIAEEDWILLVPKSHELATQPSVPLRQLRDENLILFSGSLPLRLVIDQFLERAGVTSKPIIEVGWMDMILRAVELGLGITVVPRAVSTLPMGDVAIVEIDEPEVPRRVLMAFYLADRPESHFVKLFLEMITDRVSSLVRADQPGIATDNLVRDLRSP